MLVVYLSSLIVGGSLLTISIFAGGDSDSDVDAADGDVDFHADADADLHVDDVDASDHDGGFDAMAGWLPVTSLRFWTFFAAFFGLVGTALLIASPMSVALTAIPSTAVGYFSGLVAVRVLRGLANQRIGSTLGVNELVGAVGRLSLPVSPEREGKIRLQLADRTVELIAESDDETLELGTSAVVLGVRDDGGVWVSRAPQLGDGQSED